MAPRAFERPATIALSGEGDERGLALDGLYIPGSDVDSPGAVVAPPHPLYGGSMDHPVATEIAYACERAGFASLRFNWRGVGASGGESSGEADDARDDYRAAMAFLEETVSGPIVACGYSYGAVAAVAASARDPRVRRLLLVAPPYGMLDLETLRAFGRPVLIAVGEADVLASAIDLQRLAGELEKCTFVAIEETDHFFMSSIGVLGRAAYEWLAAPGGATPASP